MTHKAARLTKKQKKDFVDKLFETSAPNINFFLMLTLSAIIVTLGLLINNSTIVIGGMLIAPLLYPILSLAMGIVVSDYRLIRNSGYVIVKSIVVIIVISVIISFLTTSRELNMEILSRIQHVLVYFIIAFFSGVAAAYASSHPRMSDILPGVAIAVSLIPPLAVFGIGMSFLHWNIIVQSLLMFGLNLLGITFASLMVFSILNFHSVKDTITRKTKKVEEEIKAEEKKKEKKEEDKEKVELKKEMKEIKKTLEETTKIIKDKDKPKKKKKKKKSTKKTKKK